MLVSIAQPGPQVLCHRCSCVWNKTKRFETCRFCGCDDAKLTTEFYGWSTVCGYVVSPRPDSLGQSCIALVQRLRRAGSQPTQFWFNTDHYDAITARCRAVTGGRVTRISTICAVPVDITSGVSHLDFTHNDKQFVIRLLTRPAGTEFDL